MPRPPSGVRRCPACREPALPRQTRCLKCDTRLGDLPPGRAGSFVPQDETAAPSLSDGHCPGCGKAWPDGAVLCVECGHDLRLGRKRETFRPAAGDEPPRLRRGRRAEPLPAGFRAVRLGLGFHYARLVLSLLALLAVMGLVCYAGTTKAGADDAVLVVGGAAAEVLVLLTALLGTAGSALCLGTERGSAAWWFILIAFILNLLTVPVVVYLRVAELPAFFAYPAEFVEWLFFMLFLRRLALRLDRPGEANEATALITRGVAVFVGAPLLLILIAMTAFLTAISSTNSLPLFLLAGVLVLVVQLVFLILLFFGVMGNIQTLRTTITARLPGREEGGGPSRAVADEA